jgi:hypothetical protein
MAQLKDFPADARAGNWHEFLVGYAERFGANVSPSAAEPETADGYWKACRV